MLKIADNQLQWIRYCCAKMVFSKENNILIKSLRELKGCEKLFTVAAQTNSERSFYVRQGTRKKDVNENRLLRTRSTFSKSVVVSVGISKLGCTDIHFIERAGYQSERGILSRQPSCPEATARHALVGPERFFLYSNRTAPRRIEHATPSLSWIERRRTSFLQHCDHQICRTLTRSSTASGVCCRRRFTTPG